MSYAIKSFNPPLPIKISDSDYLCWCSLTGCFYCSVFNPCFRPSQFPVMWKVAEQVSKHAKLLPIDLLRQDNREDGEDGPIIVLPPLPISTARWCDGTVGQESIWNSPRWPLPDIWHLPGTPSPPCLHPSCLYTVLSPATIRLFIVLSNHSPPILPRGNSTFRFYLSLACLLSSAPSCFYRVVLSSRLAPKPT